MPAKQSDVAGDPEQLVCPNGHRTWERTVEHFWCYDRSRIHDVDLVFDELLDPAPGDTVPRTGVPAT